MKGNPRKRVPKEHGDAHPESGRIQIAEVTSSRHGEALLGRLTYQADQTRPASVASGLKICVKPIVRCLLGHRS